MTKKRAGFHNLLVQIPDAVWEALSDDALSRGLSVAKVLTEMLCKKYRIPAGKIPRPKRAGRRPKPDG